MFLIHKLSKWANIDIFRGEGAYPEPGSRDALIIKVMIISLLYHILKHDGIVTTNQSSQFPLNISHHVSQLHLYE